MTMGETDVFNFNLNDLVDTALNTTPSVMVEKPVLTSPRFTYDVLTATNYKVANVPNEAELKNLDWLSTVLDEIYETIGPFKVISGFRSSALQEALRSDGAPTAEKKSFHEAGMAVDLVPLNTNLDDFFGQLIVFFREKLGEIAIKPSQNTIHLSLPTIMTQGKILFLNEANEYIKMAQDKIEEYVGPILASIGQTVEEFNLEVKKKPITYAAIAIAIIASIGTLWFLSRNKKVTKNPLVKSDVKDFNKLNKIHEMYLLIPSSKLTTDLNRRITRVKYLIDKFKNGRAVGFNDIRKEMVYAKYYSKRFNLTI